MPELEVSSLTTWENFYVIVGSGAAALTGLMFVVITLIAGRRERFGDTGDDAGIAAFGTPTVVHFCAALGVAATLSAPWPALGPAALLLGLSGLAGVGYLAVVVRRVRRQATYTPVLEDWLWHMGFPLAAYVALVGAAFALVGVPTPALFVVGAATVLLLFVGIHNAWDTVTFLVVDQAAGAAEKE